MIIYYDATGAKRKRLVQELGQILGWEPVYMGAPTFAYNIGNYIVSKNGNITCPDSATAELVDTIVQRLRESGFEPISVEYGILTVELPLHLFSQLALSRLVQIVASKETLFMRAFQANELNVVKREETIAFPWFKLTGVDGEVEAYSQFIDAIGQMARTQTRITAKPYEGDNDKFAMRIFLVRLGLIGKKYKLTRKILMRNLTGNSAWKNGPPLTPVPEPEREAPIPASQPK